MNLLQPTHEIDREGSSRTKENSRAPLEGSKNPATLAKLRACKEANSGKIHTLGSNAW
jgi:hypothetical protein